MRRARPRASALLSLALAAAAVALLGLVALRPPAPPPAARAPPPGLRAAARAPPPPLPRPPPPPPPPLIPRRLLFCFGFFDATFRLDLSARDCDFSGPSPPPCVLLARAARALPAAVASRIQQWAARYPEWEVVVVDPAAAARAAAARAPAAAPLLAALRAGAQRADVARLALLAAYGGVYADVDAAPGAGDLDELLAAHARARALFFEEAFLTPTEAAAAAAHAVRGGRAEARQRIANYFMASAPAGAAAGGGAAGPCARGAVDAVLALVAARALARPALDARDADYEVLWTTGPDAVTDAVHALRGWALDGADIVGAARLDAARDIETPARRGAAPGAPDADECAAVVPRPVDQRYFAHEAAGGWKGRGGRA